MHPLFIQEAELITKFFKLNDIKAKVDRDTSLEVKTGYFRFGLKFAPTERFSKVENSQRELSTLLSKHRRSIGLNGDIAVMISTYPMLALELPHPEPSILEINNLLIFDGAPHTMLLGRSYLTEERNEETILDDLPHSLIAGITGAGKSKLMQAMLLSLVARTPSTELKLFLIDLKNEDFVPLRKLPHVTAYASNTVTAMEILERITEEKVRRIEDYTSGSYPYRIVLAIDEMAQLAGTPKAVKLLGDLASIGRSKMINVIGATQQPTKEGGMGSLLKANFSQRLVGQVAPGQSRYATDRPGTHAELLPGKGSFLRCSGPNVYRFQSYYLDLPKVDSLAKRIASNDREVTKSVMQSVTPVTEEQIVTGVYSSNGYGVTTLPYTSNTETQPITVIYNDYVTKSTFPIKIGRPLTEPEIQEICLLIGKGDFGYAGKTNWTKLCMYVYGSKNDKRVAWLREALEVTA